MITEKRKIVIPGQLLGDAKQNKKAGLGTFPENGKVYAEILGFLDDKKNDSSEYIDVKPLKGRYDPKENDILIGIVEEAMSSSWLVDINAAYPALLHVNEVPWDVEFGETDRYLNHGDSIKAKVLQVDQEKKLQITLKDRELHKINDGYILEVEPSKVRRIKGKQDSMINLLKKYTNCRIFVGQNGRIWINGNEEGIQKVIDMIKLIEEEALSYGLTDRVENLLKKDAKEVH